VKPDLPRRAIRTGPIAVLSLIAQVSSAIAGGAESISGDYVCAYGCRVTDAAPSVEIDGDNAACTNELGGIFHGKVLSDHSISCFNKTGVLSADGKTILWDGGVVWRRLSRP
jgi:hypothetical protein